MQVIDKCKQHKCKRILPNGTCWAFINPERMWNNITCWGMTEDIKEVKRNYDAMKRGNHISRADKQMAKQLGRI